LNEQRLVSTLDGAAELAALGIRLSYRMVRRLPVVGEVLRQGMVAVGEHLLAGQGSPGARWVPNVRAADAVLTRIDVVPVLERIEINDVVSRVDLDSVVGRLDINAVVERLDLDAVLARIDVDELVARLDVDSIISRIDVVGPVAVIRNQVSLSALLRNSARNAVSDARVNRRAVIDHAAPAGPRQH
jgi:sigma54-dependent transcription regulator